MRKFIYKVLLGGNMIFAAALVLSYLAVHISPEDFVLPAFFGLAYPYLLLINVLFVIVWAVMLKFEALISVVIIAAGINHLSNYIRFGRTSGDKEDTFKVISYNVRLLNNFEKQGASSESRIFEFLSEQQPDILCLQEFFVNGSPVLKEPAIRKMMGGKYYSHLKVIGNGRNRYYGILTLTKFPVVNKGEIIHPASSSLSIFTDIVIESDTFRVFNNHLQSFRLRSIERSFIEEITTADDDVTISQVKNISRSLRTGFVQRALQADAVKNEINKSPWPVIVAGDFNDTPVSYSYRKMRKGLNDSFVNSGYGAGFTYKGNYPANRIDYILHDNSLESTWFDILKVRYSDHYPVAAYLRKRRSER